MISAMKKNNAKGKISLLSAGSDSFTFQIYSEHSHFCHFHCLGQATNMCKAESNVVASRLDTLS